MAVTELAILQLPSHQQPPTAQLLLHLQAAKRAMQKSSGFNFFYFHCLEDPSIIFIIGAWPSLDYHLNVWIPSPENQELLKLLEGEVSVLTMFHVDIDQSRQLPPIGASVLAIGRHFIKDGERDGFEAAFQQGRKGLDEYAGRDNVVGGWRIDKEGDGKEEFVLLTGWQDKEQHLGFATMEGWKEYSKIRDFLDKAEIVHAKELRTS